jgi:hypothetical protein
MMYPLRNDAGRRFIEKKKSSFAAKISSKGVVAFL